MRSHSESRWQAMDRPDLRIHQRTPRYPRDARCASSRGEPPSPGSTGPRPMYQRKHGGALRRQGPARIPPKAASTVARAVFGAQLNRQILAPATRRGKPTMPIDKTGGDIASRGLRGRTRTGHLATAPSIAKTTSADELQNPRTAECAQCNRFSARPSRVALYVDISP